MFQRVEYGIEDHSPTITLEDIPGEIYVLRGFCEILIFLEVGNLTYTIYDP